MSSCESNDVKNPPLLLVVLWLCCTILLGFGLTRPVIGITANIEGVIRDTLESQPVIGLMLQERGIKLSDIGSKLPAPKMTTQSVISSASKLYHLGNYTAAALIFMFSIILPICKQVILLASLASSPGNPNRLANTVISIHKWAMLDVFALSIVVISISSSSSWNASILDGFYWFLSYFFAAGILGEMLSRKIGLRNE